MAYIDYKGHKLAYEVEGQGSNSLVFIHGLFGDHRVWSRNIPAFVRNNRVISIDMFGHGNSSSDISPKEAFESMPDVLEKLIIKEGLKNVVLIGHSIAGNILSSCIEQNLKNVCGYVFVDSTFNATERVVNSRNKLADSLLSNSAEQLNSSVIAWYKTMMDMNASVEDNDLIFSAQKILNRTWVLNFLKATNLIRQAPKTTLPVLLFESDWLIKDEPERAFSKVLTQAEVSHWPIFNHFFFVYEAQKFNQRVQEFLNKIN